MFIHNRGQNFFSTRWPHSFNILSRVQNSEIPFPSHLTNLFLFSNIFIISFTFKVKFFLQNCYIFIQRFVYTFSSCSLKCVPHDPQRFMGKTVSVPHFNRDIVEYAFLLYFQNLKTLRCWKLLQRFTFLSPSAWCT